MIHRALPPFSALQAFEASARHGSFRRAAEELCVTQSAISHRIKELEAFLGVPLFHRLTRQVVLTGRGEDYFSELGDVLDRMHEATLHVRDFGLLGPLSIRGTPAFVTRWLLPRMNIFRSKFPNIELHVSTTAGPVDFAIEDVDVVVRWGVEPQAGLHVAPILETASYPVASPTFLRNGPPIIRPADLLQHVLLHEEVDDDWPRWLSLAGVDHAGAGKGPIFEHCDLALHAAIEGQGIALAYAELVTADIAAGRLVRLFDIELPPTAIYSVVTPDLRLRRPAIAAFFGWILAESQRTARGAPMQHDSESAELFAPSHGRSLS